MTLSGRGWSAIALAAALVAVVGLWLNRIDHNKDRIWWSAYKANHACVEGRYGVLCYKRPRKVKMASAKDEIGAFRAPCPAGTRENPDWSKPGKHCIKLVS